MAPPIGLPPPHWLQSRVNQSQWATVALWRRSQQVAFGLYNSIRKKIYINIKFKLYLNHHFTPLHVNGNWPTSCSICQKQTTCISSWLSSGRGGKGAGDQLTDRPSDFNRIAKREEKKNRFDAEWTEIYRKLPNTLKRWKYFQQQQQQLSGYNWRPPNYLHSMALQRWQT